MRIRINRYLARCGIGSRRSVEQLIRDGRISVNGEKIGKFTILINPDVDIVEYDNRELKPIQNKYYLILNKPKGYITSMKDTRGRPIVMDLIPEKYKRSGVFPIGRLDRDTEGILLLTNDGEIAYRLTHPKFGIQKKYLVTLDKPLDKKVKSKIERGIILYGEKTKPALVSYSDENRRTVTITLSEGKKRQIRMTFKNFGYHVIRLQRYAYGPLTLRGIDPGSTRVLRKHEIASLHQLCTQKGDHLNHLEEKRIDESSPRSFPPEKFS